MIRHRKRPRKKPEKPAKSSKSKLLEVTVSMGVAEKTDNHKAPADVIKSADEALYKAKKKGRNRIVVA
jgi:diguanylate cyclase (GGDEF)-like protein